MTVNVTPNDGGTVKVNGTTYYSFPAYKSVADNSTVLFQAIPAEGYEFVQWGGPLSGNVNPITYLVTCDTSVFATFQEVANEPPIANAGDDQTGDEGTTVILDGSGSFDPDGDIAAYQWTQTEGTDVALSDSTAAQPSFTAPDTGTEGETLTFELIVEDAGGLEDSDTCTVTVRDTVEPPPTPPVNEPPVADSGEDQNVIEGTTVTLDGSGSFDPDGSITSYQWTQTVGANVALSDSTAVSPTFVTPPIADETVMSFELTVVDNEGLQSTNENPRFR